MLLGMLILFSGESVHHPKDRGGLEFNAGERGDCIQKTILEKQMTASQKNTMQNEDEDEGHGLADHGGSWR